MKQCACMIILALLMTGLAITVLADSSDSSCEEEYVEFVPELEDGAGESGEMPSLMDPFEEDEGIDLPSENEDAACQHELIRQEAEEATCLNPGKQGHWLCRLCGKKFIDSLGVLEIENVDIPRLPHEMTEYPGMEPTCENNGRRTYWHCSGCGYDYADSLGQEIIEDLNSWIVIPSCHELQHVPGRKPTCTEEGTQEYWQCQRCQRRFSDAAGETPLESFYIPAFGHQWEVYYSWEEGGCAAERVCLTDPSHCETDWTVPAAYVTRLPTCTDWGETTYIAFFTEPWAEPQVYICRDIPPLGHDWQEIDYQWSENGGKCTAERVCLRDPDHCEHIEGTLSREPGERPGDLLTRAHFSANWAKDQLWQPERPMRSKPPIRKTSEPELPKTELYRDTSGTFVAEQPVLVPVSQLKTQQGIAIACGMTTVAYDEKAVDTILGQTDRKDILELRVGVRSNQDPSLTEVQRNVLEKEEGQLISVSLRVNERGAPREICDFGEGQASVTLPYQKLPGQKLICRRVEADGSLVEVPTSFREDSGFLTFCSSTHSYYLVSSSVDGMVWVLLLLPAAALALGAFWYSRRKMKA